MVSNEKHHPHHTRQGHNGRPPSYRNKINNKAEKLQQYEYNNGDGAALDYIKRREGQERSQS